MLWLNADEAVELSEKRRLRTSLRCVNDLRLKAIKTLIEVGHVRQKVGEKPSKDALVPFTAS